jgi:hypothetical protein
MAFPQNVFEALAEAKKEREESKGPEARNQVIAAQVADELIAIRWALVGIMQQLSRPK